MCDKRRWSRVTGSHFEIPSMLHSHWHTSKAVRLFGKAFMRSLVTACNFFRFCLFFVRLDGREHTKEKEEVGFRHCTARRKLGQWSEFLWYRWDGNGSLALSEGFYKPSNGVQENAGDCRQYILVCEYEARDFEGVRSLAARS